MHQDLSTVTAKESSGQQSSQLAEQSMCVHATTVWLTCQASGAGQSRRGQQERQRRLDRYQTLV